MAPDPSKFWKSTKVFYPALSDDMVLMAEAKLGIRLPEEFVKLLSVQNGGYTSGFGFPMTTKTSWARDHVPLEQMNGVGSADEPLSRFNILGRDYFA